MCAYRYYSEGLNPFLEMQRRHSRRSSYIRGRTLTVWMLAAKLNNNHREESYPWSPVPNAIRQMPRCVLRSFRQVQA